MVVRPHSSSPPLASHPTVCTPPSHDLELGWINFLTLAPCNLTFVCAILCLSPPENRKVSSCSSCYSWHPAQCPAHRRYLIYFCSLSFYLLREFRGTSLLPFSAANLLFSLDHEHGPEKLIVVLDLIYKVTHSFVPSSLGPFKVASYAGASLETLSNTFMHKNKGPPSLT